jgi:hypothetical protein
MIRSAGWRMLAVMGPSLGAPVVSSPGCC